jgi:hypothetical protein
VIQIIILPLQWENYEGATQVCPITMAQKKDGIKFGFYDIYLYICIVIMA